MSIWANFDDDPQLECFILSDYTAHIDYLDTGPGGKSGHVWTELYRRYKDENKSPVRDRNLRYLVSSVGDFNGDDQYEVAFMVHNYQDKDRWRTIIRDVVS